MKFTMAIKHNGLLRKIPRSKYWQVQEEFIWFIDYKDKKEYVTIHKGFKTDFGSIPRPLQNIFQPTKYISYILHDFLYSENGQFQSDDGCLIVNSRKQADIVLREALKVEGASFIARWLIYITVRLFGFLAFKN